MAEAFGERSRDWSLGHAGDKGPHLAMTGESWTPRAWCWRETTPARPTQCCLPSTKKDSQPHPAVVPLPSRAACTCRWAQVKTFRSTQAASPVCGMVP